MALKLQLCFVSYFTGAKSCHGQLYPRNDGLGVRCVPVVSAASVLLEGPEALWLRARSSSAQPLLSLHPSASQHGIFWCLGIAQFTVCCTSSNSHCSSSHLSGQSFLALGCS